MYYIGLYSTSNLDDGYMGSGKRIRYSLNKYGIDNPEEKINKTKSTLKGWETPRQKKLEMDKKNDI